MASKAADSMSEPRKSVEDLKERGYGHLISITTEMKEEIRAIRLVQIQHKFDTNRRNMQRSMHLRFPANNKPCDVPLSGTERPLCVLNGFCPDSDDKDIANIHEVTFAKTTKLPKFPGIPKSKTWVFLKRNQRMAEDQSVVGRRRIYYDESGNEALICSDSEDDIPGVEEEKHNFSIGEDQIMLKAYSRKDSQNHIDADIADVVSHAIGASPVEIQERYKELKLKSNVPQESSSERNKFLKKSLSGVSDSLDNLFCRRCLVFDCRLHGCSQSLIYPSDKQISISEPENRKPCSDQCYLLGGQTSEAVIGRNLDIAPGEGCSAEYLSDSAVPLAQHESLAKRKFNSENNREVEVSKVLRNSVHKKSLTIQAVEPTTIVGETVSETISSAKIKKLSTKTHQCMDTQVTCKHLLEEHTASVLTDVSSQRTSSPQGSLTFRDEVREMNKRLKLMQPTVSLGKGEKGFSSNCEWKPLEKDLYRKGLEIFGRNSCLIARNLLSGLKTCSEVSSYMRDSRALMTHEMDIVCSEDNAGADIDNMEQEGLVKSRLVRKKGRSRRFKYSTKSNGLPSSLKRNSDGDQPYKQYTPCDCKFMCGKDCSCLKRGTCCEKYCGCSKGCKNKFRGCHCAKSQCRSRQCPCFAADRECDPDVCRNCWVSCGDGRFGEPPKKGDAQAQCGNMRLLLRQQQRIILGKSDVAGWGAFIKNTVNKHDYLGEYTGELISHREADKRGKIYDRANSSFLFDLNDQYVLDACRQGDKLKFANHSSNPNCYCKIMLVGGDHRVGIFAKERIEAGEELFYDYRYGDDQAPAWARGPGEPKKDDPVPSKSRARKHQSR